MSKLHFTTKHANAASVQRNWYVVDGTNQTVGRICSRIAAVLRGKNKAYYTPHVDCGDFIVLINADKVKFTGNKLGEKEYQTVSGYPGGQKIEIANPAIRGLVESWTQEKLPLDKRFVYYLLAAKGVCVVPISSFCSELEGFRVTLLEEDESTLVKTFESIRDGINQYIRS